jgi:ribulose-5-phosphate 4-epimerase/fuculose-1-phosphate aldolase
LSLDLLVALSQRIGASVPLWTQGPGGNVSWKSGTDLWIKPSGRRLDQVQSTNDLARLHYVDLKELLPTLMREQNEEGYAKALTDTSADGKRPSMEAAFHAIHPLPFVMHFHALSALMMADMHFKNELSILSWLQKRWQGKLVILPFVNPGLGLAATINKVIDHDCVILRNHGVILSGENSEVLDRWQALEEDFYLSFNFERLLDLKHKKFSDLSSEWQQGQMQPRVYFPDTIVFWERVLKAAAVKNGSDLDARELWLAGEILYQACPNMSEIEHNLRTLIAEMPVETLRKLEVKCN